MLTVWYEIQEQEKLFESQTEPDKQAIQHHIEILKKLNQLKYQCNLPNVNKVISEIDKRILINNIAKDQILTPAKKRIRNRGKIVPLKDRENNIVYKTDSTGNPIQRRYKEGNLVWKTDEKGNLKFDRHGDKIPVYFSKEKWAKGDSIQGSVA